MWNQTFSIKLISELRTLIQPIKIYLQAIKMIQKIKNKMGALKTYFPIIIKAEEN